MARVARIVVNGTVVSDFAGILRSVVTYVLLQSATSPRFALYRCFAHPVAARQRFYTSRKNLLVQWGLLTIRRC
jgi:hypothetical protein